MADATQHEVLRCIVNLPYIFCSGSNSVCSKPLLMKSYPTHRACGWEGLGTFKQYLCTLATNSTIYLGRYSDWSSLLREWRVGRFEAINRYLHVAVVRVTGQMDGIVPR